MATRITDTDRFDTDFIALTSLFDDHLIETYGAEVMKDFHPLNALNDIIHAVVVYCDGEPCACGGIKPFDDTTVEVKRIFVKPECRKRGLGSMVMKRLEELAIVGGYKRAVLETAADMTAAQALYIKRGFTRMENYPPYEGNPLSVCFEKRLTPHKADIMIRTANASDAPLIEKLAEEIWMQHYVSIITPEQIRFMLTNYQSTAAILQDMQSGAVYDIAYTDGEPCGYSMTIPDDSGLFLSKLYMRQSCRGRGIARKMVNRIDGRAKELGASRIWLKCNKHNTGSLAAYERLGFTIAYPCVTDIGGGFVMDDYALEKKL